MRIIKGCWPMDGIKPKWAILARDRGWMTLAAYLQVPLESGGGIRELLYRDSPLLGMIRRSA